MSRGPNAQHWRDAISDAMVKVWENRHGDPVLYQQWLRAFLDATVRNPDWLVAKNGLYYKLRELVRMDPSVPCRLLLLRKSKNKSRSR